jgi:hypothetical protein
LKEVPEDVVLSVSMSVVNNSLIYNSFDGPILEGFDIYTLLNALSDNNEKAKQNLKEQFFERDELKAFDFFKLHCGRIEIAYDSVLIRNYFPIKPVCHFLSRSTRKILMLKVNRDSPGEKITDLMRNAPALIEEMEHNEKLARSLIKITPKTFTYLRDFSTLISIFINILLLAFKKYNYSENYRT